MKEKRFITFRDGSRGIVRPISPADQRAFIEGFESLSEESRFRRFFFNKKALTATDLERLSHPDGINHIAYGVAAVEENGSETPISVGHCFRDGDSPLAEVAIVTADLWQGNGAGYELLLSLKSASLAAGINQWLAVLLADNTTMTHLLEKIGRPVTETANHGGVLEVIYEIG